jgi:hypothetical protein
MIEGILEGKIICKLREILQKSIFRPYGALEGVLAFQERASPVQKVCKAYGLVGRGFALGGSM